MHAAQHLLQIGILLLALGLLSRLGSAARLSSIPLYLLLGVALASGPDVLGGGAEQFISVGAEIGVVLMLLMLGLEYSARELAGTVRHNALAGVVDLTVNAAPGAVLALLLGWGPTTALALAGVSAVSSSGIVAKVLHDTGRLGNRETPTILAVLVLEDIAMTVYLPVLVAVGAGAGFLAGSATVAVALAALALVVAAAVLAGPALSRGIAASDREAALLLLLGLTLAVAGLAEYMGVSAAVGAFLVGIALSGSAARDARKSLVPLRDLFAAVFFVYVGLSIDVAAIPQVLLPAAGLAAVTAATKISTGWWAAARAGVGRAGRWRAGATLVPRGEFSIVIAGLAVAAGAPSQLLALSATYVLILAIVGPMLAHRGSRAAAPDTTIA